MKQEWLFEASLVFLLGFWQEGNIFDFKTA